MKRFMQNLIMIVCFCSFCFFSYKIYTYKIEEKQQNKLNDYMIESAIKINNQDDEIEEKSELPIEVDFISLKNQNQDIIAWLYSEGTPINYPIVQTKDNDYYLRRLIDGTYNKAGTIFMDYKNSKNFEDYNTIIYGHNMKNDSMFGTLLNYKNQEYFNEHKEMFLITENKNFKIEIFAGYTTSSESDIYKFPKTMENNERLLKTAINKSTFKSEVEVTKEDKIITFSTCSYDFQNARYILLGILREIE